MGYWTSHLGSRWRPSVVERDRLASVSLADALGLTMSPELARKIDQVIADDGSNPERARRARARLAARGYETR